MKLRKHVANISSGRPLYLFRAEACRPRLICWQLTEYHLHFEQLLSTGCFNSIKSPAYKQNAFNSWVFKGSSYFYRSNCVIPEPFLWRRTPITLEMFFINVSMPRKYLYATLCARVFLYGQWLRWKCLHISIHDSFRIKSPNRCFPALNLPINNTQCSEHF